MMLNSDQDEWGKIIKIFYCNVSIWAAFGKYKSEMYDYTSFSGSDIQFKRTWGDMRGQDQGLDT